MSYTHRYWHPHRSGTQPVTAQSLFSPYGWAVRMTLFVLSFVTGAIGIAMLALGGLGLRPSVVSPGATILIASLVAATAAAGMETWREEKRRTSDAKARDTYERLAATLMSRFSPGAYNAAAESGLRSSVAAWGAPSVVSALADWNAAYDGYVPSGVSGPILLTTEAQNALRKATVAAIVAIRAEIAVGGVEPSRIERALFNTDRPADIRTDLPTPELPSEFS